MVSPVFVNPSPLSNTEAVFSTLTLACDVIITSVGSSVVLPSASFPSSLTSTASLVPYALLAVAVATLEIFVESYAC